MNALRPRPVAPTARRPRSPLTPGCLALLAIACSGAPYEGFPPDDDEFREFPGDPTAPYPLRFPARIDRQVADSVFASSGHSGSYAPGWSIDTGVRRYVAGAWRASVASSQSPGGLDGTLVANGETFTFNTPLFAPEDGEVVACWNTTPDKPGPGRHYDFDGDGIDDESPTRGGNHLLIRTAAGNHLIYLAHLAEGSIPDALCPLGATPDWPSGATQSCDLPDGLTNGPYVDAVLPIPVPVSAGDFVGRAGHSGASGAPHLHLAVYPTATDEEGDICYGATVEMLFTDTWDQQNVGPPTDADWNFLDEENNLPGSHLFLADFKHEATRTPGLYRSGDFDGDGRDDLLCHSVSSGRLWIDRMNDGLDGTDVSENNGFCDAERERLHIGDFNGDGRDDLLCHDQNSGHRDIDWAGFGAQFNGLNHLIGNAWCHGETQQLHVGDFDSDGEADLLCHDISNGQRFFDLAADGLGSTDDVYGNAWCNAPFQRLHVGRFAFGGGDGLLCHDERTGYLWIDNPASPASIAAGGDVLGASNYDEEQPSYCAGGAKKLFVANVGGNSRDELVCHDADTGQFEVNAPDLFPPHYPLTDWSSGETGWCTSAFQRLRFADVDGDGRDDAVCFDQKLGRRWIDLAAPGRYFAGSTDDSEYSGWCYQNTQALH